MPHLTLEYTDNLKLKVNLRKLFSELHSEIFATGEFVFDEIKSRAIMLEDYYIGDGNPDKAFIHLKISMLDSRNLEFKKSVARNLLTVLNKYYTVEVTKKNCQVCVELVDIRSDCYFKFFNQ
jgi:5-carboxymethyl-2-hydroxymuconate isomerase